MSPFVLYILCQDRDIKATVYRISGAILSGNYIQFPKATSQSLGLTGRFLYLIFRPVPTKYFSIHFELATDSGLAMRVSLSNLFKEFKTTSTWLQFPFSSLLLDDGKESTVQGEHIGQRTKQHAVKGHRWILLVLDLRAILTQHLNVNFAYVKTIQLCANILVKGVFTSHTEYSPRAEGPIEPVGLQGTQPLPREMRLPLGKTEVFEEVYDYIRFPLDGVWQRRIGCVEVGGRKSGPPSTRGPSTMEVVSVKRGGREIGEDVRDGNMKRGGLKVNGFVYVL